MNPTSSSDLTSESGDAVGSQVTRADMGAPNQAGRRLGDFQLEKKIGQGGMGEVYRARQISLDRPVAVKVLTRGLASQPGFVERFQREAKAAANVVHPHIIQIYAYGIDNGTPYFAMEYVEGEDLQQRMRRVKKIPLDEIVDTMIATASALGGAHERNMIHRDVKPSNVMIDRSGNVKVMDFGLAKAASADGSLTQSGVIMGTPNYLSPEQGRGDPIDGRADLYSLGVVMYELLAGDLPFRADTPAGLIFKHVYEDPVPLSKRSPGVPKFIEEVVHRLLRKDPADRYQNAKELLVDLNEFMDGFDHYMAGGERRAGLASSSRLRGQARGGDTTMTDQPAVGPPDAPTQPTPRKDVPLADAQNNRSQVTIIREKSSLAPLWILVFMTALGGGAWVLYQNGTLAKWGVLQKQLKLQFAANELPTTVVARLESLDGPTRIDLKADEGYFLEAGKYRITVDRKGYQRIRTDLLVQDDGGKASLVMPPSGTIFQLRFDPTPEMVDAYTKAREAILRGRSSGDKDAFNDARALLAKVEDPSFSMNG
ncbi:MAG: serine/threonine-protein kinase, partial [Planctomycetota bacterium]